jgi:hypothetical protein
MYIAIAIMYHACSGIYNSVWVHTQTWDYGPISQVQDSQANSDRG